MGNKTSSQKSTPTPSSSSIPSSTPVISYMGSGGTAMRNHRVWEIPIPDTDNVYLEAYREHDWEDFPGMYFFRYMKPGRSSRHISPTGQHFTAFYGCLGITIYQIDAQPTGNLDAATMALVASLYKQKAAIGEHPNAGKLRRYPEEIIFETNKEPNQAEQELGRILFQQLPNEKMDFRFGGSPPERVHIMHGRRIKPDPPLWQQYADGPKN